MIDEKIEGAKVRLTRGLSRQIITFTANKLPLMQKDSKISKEVALHVLPFSALPRDERDLVLKAKEVSENAHAPYSDFQVGAAVLLEGGEIVGGNNQENASFPVGICAERVALSAAGANFPKRAPLKIAIAAKPRSAEKYGLVTPCGLCLQTMAEVEKRYARPVAVLLYADDDHIYRSDSLDNFLPFRFSSF